MKKRSILTNDMEHCYVCGSPYTEVHHVFFGTSNRKNSEKYKIVLPLCNAHHTGSSECPHRNKEVDLEYKRMGQQAFERLYGHEEFMRVFGKNYL